VHEALGSIPGTGKKKGKKIAGTFSKSGYVWGRETQGASKLLALYFLS
jgi:hypothetical protein